MYSMKSSFWTNEKVSLMVEWSSSVSISCFKVQSSIGHLVWFFDSKNSIVSGANLWCPWALIPVSRKKPKCYQKTQHSQNVVYLRHLPCHIITVLITDQVTDFRFVICSLSATKSGLLACSPLI